MAQATDKGPGGSKSFRAKYHSACAACPEDIFPGELVHFVDDDLRHVVCDTEVDRLADLPLAEPCPRCFMLLTPAGICPMCED